MIFLAHLHIQRSHSELQPPPVTGLAHTLLFEKVSEVSDLEGLGITVFTLVFVLESTMHRLQLQPE